uniref:Uncharacterized protein n=1 Tax=Glossina palpalis gambiensis TaxID=67801 RepID=A0A1B0BT43_9MUSC
MDLDSRTRNTKLKHKTFMRLIKATSVSGYVRTFLLQLVWFFSRLDDEQQPLAVQVITFAAII